MNGISLALPACRACPGQLSIMFPSASVTIFRSKPEAKQLACCKSQSRYSLRRAVLKARPPESGQFVSHACCVEDIYAKSFPIESQQVRKTSAEHIEAVCTCELATTCKMTHADIGKLTCVIDGSCPVQNLHLLPCLLTLLSCSPVTVPHHSIQHLHTSLCLKSFLEAIACCSGWSAFTKAVAIVNHHAMFATCLRTTLLHAKWYKGNNAT